MFLRYVVGLTAAFAQDAAPPAPPPPPPSAPPAPAPAPPPPPPEVIEIPADASEMHRKKIQRTKDFPMLMACNSGNVEKFDEAVRNGADIHAAWEDVDFEDCNCAYMAAHRQNGNYLGVLSRFIALNGNINHSCKSRYHATPIYEALQNGDQKAFDVLITHTKSFEGSGPRGEDIVQRGCVQPLRDAENPTMTFDVCEKLHKAGVAMGQLEQAIVSRPKDPKWDKHRALLGMEPRAISHDEL